MPYGQPLPRPHREARAPRPNFAKPQLGVHQALDQSLEDPMASVESEEGKHRFHITFWDKISTFTFHLLLFTSPPVSYGVALKPRCMILRTLMLFYKYVRNASVML
jgi:hypothetical protein